MWPDHETDYDLLGYQHFVAAVVNIATNEGLLPATVGVYGDWGSGKSSLLRMVTSELGKQDGVLVLSFNGWLFEGYDDAKTALMETILDEIAAKRTLTDKGKTLLWNLAKKVNWLRVAGRAVKYGLSFGTGGPAALAATAGPEMLKDVSGVVENLQDMNSEQFAELLRSQPENAARRGIREFRSEFEALLAEAQGVSTLVVVIDDLDRCLPDTVIETLEAIKLFLFVKNTAFILGADERLIKYAVRRRFPELPGERAEVGRDYLEKLIQFPLRIPPLGPVEMQNFICLLCMQAAGVARQQLDDAREWRDGSDPQPVVPSLGYASVQKIVGGVPAHLAETLVLAERIAPILARGLNGNPRQCKRFLNTLLMRLEMARTKGICLEQKVLAKLMLLEYFRPESFRLLGRLQAAQGGQLTELSAIEATFIAENTSRGSQGGRGQAKSRNSREAPKAEATEQGETAKWLEDEWLAAWIRMEPRLADTDLRPYFYFSRDILVPTGSVGGRLSPVAQEMLQRLLSRSDGVRQTALKSASQVSSGDASAVFEELCQRVRQHEELGADDSPLKPLFDWTDARKELAGQLVVFLDSLPEVGLPISTVPMLLRACNSTSADRNAFRLLEKWSTASEANPRLAKAAQMKLKREVREGD